MPCYRTGTAACADMAAVYTAPAAAGCNDSEGGRPRPQRAPRPVSGSDKRLTPTARIRLLGSPRGGFSEPQPDREARRAKDHSPRREPCGIACHRCRAPERGERLISAPEIAHIGCHIPYGNSRVASHRHGSSWKRRRERAGMVSPAAMKEKVSRRSRPGSGR